MSGQPPHQLVSDDHLHKCVCEDWHPGSFFVEAARPELLPAADPGDFVLEGYEPAVDDFGNQYLARSRGLPHPTLRELILAADLVWIRQGAIDPKADFERLHKAIKAASDWAYGLLEAQP